MNERIKKHLTQYCEKKEWGTDEDDLIEALTEAKRLYREEIGQHRWWNEFRYVVEIDGMLIGYIHAEANRDESMSDLGYEFDVSSICEMRPVEKTVTVYEPIAE